MSNAQRRASIVAVLLLVAAGLFTLNDFLPARLWAAILAIGLSPLFDRMATRWPRNRRSVLPMLTIIAVLLVFVVPVAMIASAVASDAHAAAAWAATVQHNGITPPAFLASLPLGNRLTTLWQQELSQPGQALALASHVMQGSLLTTGRTIGAQAVHRLVLLGFMLLALFFLLRDLDYVDRQLRIGTARMFGVAGENVGLQMIRSIHGTVTGWFWSGSAKGSCSVSPK